MQARCKGEGEDKKIIMKTLNLQICNDCIKGIGEECHTPGCALFLHAVDLPIDERLSIPTDCTELKARLAKIAEIIEAVDNRCMAADGPVTPTLQEMTQTELSAIYAIARQAVKALL